MTWIWRTVFTRCMSPSSIIARELGVIVNLDKVDRMLGTLRGIKIVTVVVMLVVERLRTSSGRSGHIPEASNPLRILPFERALPHAMQRHSQNTCFPNGLSGFSYMKS